MTQLNFNVDYVAKLVATDLKVQLATKLLSEIDAAINELVKQKRAEILTQIMPLAKSIVEKTVVQQGFNVDTGGTNLQIAVILDGKELL